MMTQKNTCLRYQGHIVMIATWLNSDELIIKQIAVKELHLCCVVPLCLAIYYKEHYLPSGEKGCFK